MSATLLQYSQVIEKCKKLFAAKQQLYGSSWRILRLPAFTDQIFIKAQRIRTIQEKERQVEEGVLPELMGIANYSILALVQLGLAEERRLDLPLTEVLQAYDGAVDRVRLLLSRKNHDYDEAWREMRVSSMVDIILMKLLRLKSIEESRSYSSAAAEEAYTDILNYAVFAMILLAEESNPPAEPS